jgi:hypothetical protein
VIIASRPGACFGHPEIACQLTVVPQAEVGSGPEFARDEGQLVEPRPFGIKKSLYQ